MRYSNIEIGKIMPTKNYGDFKILDDLGRVNNKHLIQIEFINTGSIQTVELYEAKRGNVKDATASKKLHFDSNVVYHSKNYGDYRIIADDGFAKNIRRVIIKFIDTGYENSVPYYDALCGNVKDIFYPYIYDVGYIGTKDIIKNNPIDNILYRRWRNMISRCYNPTDIGYENYGGVGVIVNNEWHNFNNYRRDVKLLHGYNLFLSNPKRYHIDKDYLQPSSSDSRKIYSVNTCIWLDSKYNSNILTCMDETDYIGIYIYNGLYYVAVYTYMCTLNIHGPLTNLNAALYLFNSLPSIYEFSHIKHNCNHVNNISQYYMNLKPMCSIIN